MQGRAIKLIERHAEYGVLDRRVEAAHAEERESRALFISVRTVRVAFTVPVGQLTCLDAPTG